MIEEGSLLSRQSACCAGPVSQCEQGTSGDGSIALRKLNLLWPFLCLLLVEAVAFGINLKQVGVYQDEWICFGQLHFVQHSLEKIFSTIFWDPRYIVRPVTAFHYAPLFYFFWEKPFWYHVVCYVSEFLGGCFLYLAIERLTRSRMVGLAAAVLFLLYPTHDSTHYYITASSEQVSASFFTLSLWLFLKGIDEGGKRWLVWSGLAYFMSVYNYEQTLPLLALFPLLSLLLLKPEQKPPRNYLTFAAYQIPFVLVAASMVVFRSWLLPKLGLGWHYTTTYSLSNFVNVMVSGINVSLSPYLLTFCGTMAGDALKDGLSIFSWVCLAAAMAGVLACSVKLGDNAGSQSRNLVLILAGAVALVCSYTIFGFSPEHMPVLDGWRNRVNICGAFGASLIVAGLLGIGANLLGRFGKQAKNVTFAVVLSLLSGFFILVNWEFAKAWIVSWHTQKELMATLRTHSSSIKSGDSVIIGGITRYARWAPVVDGVWDFQNIVRTTLNDKSINGTVITDRLTIDPDALVDRSGILVLGTFPYKNMVLFSPDHGQWVRISTRQQFIDQARRLGWKIAGTELDSHVN